MRISQSFPNWRDATILAGSLLLAASVLGQPTQACHDCLTVSNIGSSGDDGVESAPADPAAIDQLMGALPGPGLPGSNRPMINGAGPQPEPPTRPKLGADDDDSTAAALLLPAVQAAREAARRAPASQTRLPVPSPPATGPSSVDINKYTSQTLNVGSIRTQVQ